MAKCNLVAQEPYTVLLVLVRNDNNRKQQTDLGMANIDENGLFEVNNRSASACWPRWLCCCRLLYFLLLLFSNVKQLTMSNLQRYGNQQRWRETYSFNGLRYPLANVTSIKKILDFLWIGGFSCLYHLLYRIYTDTLLTFKTRCLRILDYLYFQALLRFLTQSEKKVLPGSIYVLLGKTFCNISNVR